MGTAAEWFTVVVAAVAVLLAWKASGKTNDLQAELLRVETDRETRTEKVLNEQRAKDEQARQADKVVVWIAGTPGTDGGHTVEWIIDNSSGLPLYDVKLTLVDPAGGRVMFEDRYEFLPPDGRKLIWSAAGFYKTPNAKSLVPGSEWDSDWHAKYRAVIEFRDTANRVWKRDEHGVIKRMGISQHLNIVVEEDRVRVVE